MKVASLLRLSAAAALLLILQQPASKAPSMLVAADAAPEDAPQPQTTTTSEAADETQQQQELLQKVRELAAHAAFVETFEDEELLDGKRWFKSAHDKYAAQEASVDEYSVRTGHVAPDRGLVLDAPARHYGLGVRLDAPLVLDGSPARKELVVQYEVKLQKGLSCGGAYVKLLRADTEDAAAGFAAFSDATPFVLMFGPDKCGSSDKVHLIFQHRSPVTGEYEEKHLSGAPQSKSDRLAHLYTAVVRDDNSFEVFVDQQSVASGSLLDSFVPPVIPDKEIDDPSDSKPADWVDEPRMPDPSAVKPADWDEDAPARIPDEDAVKPAGWLDDEPALVPDPSVAKPADWDDEDDGEWLAPTVPNPKCAEAPGCGEWARPTKANPAYRGKWRAPLVPNPAYKGEWAPRKVPNPAYFEDAHPARLAPAAALAVEVWTMSDGVTFDNFWLGYDLARAHEFANATWRPKHARELAEQEREREQERRELAERRAKDGGLVQWLETLLADFVAFAQANPLAGGGAALALAALLVASALYVCGGRGDEPRGADKDSGAEDEGDAAATAATGDDSGADKSGDSGDERKVRQRKKKAPKAE